jgi:hypothetical protein
MYKLLLFALAAAFLLIANFSPALAARYYEDQTNFAESSVPVAEYSWNQDDIEGCIYKEDGVKNSYYVWTKLAVQKWRQALREYTDNQDAWSFTARYVKSQAELESCDVKFYIYDTYKDFPDYPAQTGAYTAVIFSDRGGNVDARVYLSPIVLHGDGKTEIGLEGYAFRNSAVHEAGHVLGLGHMQSQKGYLMSPQFDFFEEDDQLPITTLELEALTQVYGTDGFG